MKRTYLVRMLFFIAFSGLKLYEQMLTCKRSPLRSDLSFAIKTTILMKGKIICTCYHLYNNRKTRMSYSHVFFIPFSGAQLRFPDAET